MLMATSYPGGYDSLPRPTASDTMNDTAGGLDGPAVIDNLSDAVEAIEAELGTDPAGTVATVAARLSAIEARLNALDSGFPNLPTVDYYGSAQMDSLGNKQVGGAYGSILSYRFRAEQASSITAVRTYTLLPPDPGYSEGTGGVIRVSVQADDGTGIPDGTDLGHYDWTPSSVFQLITFGAAIPVTQGNLYHLVYTNEDASPTVNFTSLDMMYCGVVTSPRQPGFSDTDLALLRMSDFSAWTLQTQYTPILDITYANGEHQGQGYMEVESTNKLTVSGTTSQFRQRITPNVGADIDVYGAQVRLVADSVQSGTVTITLEDSSFTELATITVDASTVIVPPVGVQGALFHGGQWDSGSSVTLSDAALYYLRVEGSSGVSVWMRGVQKGDTNSFNSATYFADGYVQQTTDSGSNWNTVSGLSTSGDAQFYMLMQP